jgi:hypothetical protein
VRLASAVSAAAAFRRLARVVVSVTGGGTVETVAPRAAVCAARCSTLFEPRTEVVLAARPRAGWSFAGWSGACSGTAELCSVVAGEGSFVSARFVRRASAAIASARIEGSWRESRFAGALVVAGRIDTAARVELRLTGPARPARFSLTLPAGAFERRLALPRGLLPGRYVLRLRGAGGTQLAETSRLLRLAAPAEGVALRAFVSVVRNGPAVTAVARGSSELWARFELAALPRRGALSVTWYRPDGGAAPAVGKPAARVVESFVADEDGLAPGVWRCELRAGSIVVAAVEARVR